MTSNSSHKQSGIVSLFAVIFSALLISVVTIGFLGIMVRDQKQATDTNLSQSAYDSALAGVEDGKRAMLTMLNTCSADLADCTTMKDKINANTCMSASDLLGETTSSGEAKLQSSGDSDQAYTCLKIDMNPSDYLGVLKKDAGKLVNLKAASSFNKVQLDWYSIEDLSSGPEATIPSIGSNAPLLDSWNSNAPSVMRVQLIQYSSSGLKLSNFDDNVSNESNSSTIFLYPATSGASDFSFFSGNRRSSSNPPGLSRVICNQISLDVTYACSVTLTLPKPIGGDETNRVAYFYITSLYNSAHYRLTLKNGSDPVKFDGLQYEIDSTGRSSDLFRRVKSRVELMSSDLPYPEAAIDVLGSLCKDFLVTDSSYVQGGCNP